MGGGGGGGNVDTYFGTSIKNNLETLTFGTKGVLDFDFKKNSTRYLSILHVFICAKLIWMTRHWLVDPSLTHIRVIEIDRL
jgi:hypothetical protein